MNPLQIGGILPKQLFGALYAVFCQVSREIFACLFFEDLTQVLFADTDMSGDFSQRELFVMVILCNIIHCTVCIARLIVDTVCIQPGIYDMGKQLLCPFQIFPGGAPGSGQC